MSLTEFVDSLFDPAEDPVRWREVRGAHQELDATTLSQYVAMVFEQAGVLLAPFTDARIEQGLRYLNQRSRIKYRAFVDEAVPEPLRLRALRSYVPLFQQVMAIRCLPEQSWGRSDDRGSPLNGECYMWWEHTFLCGEPDNPAYREFDRVALEVMESILSIPHLACQESALHGLGHWQHQYPQETAAIIDRFFAASTDLPSKLVRYAQEARRGAVL